MELQKIRNARFEAVADRQFVNRPLIDSRSTWTFFTFGQLGFYFERATLLIKLARRSDECRRIVWMAKLVRQLKCGRRKSISVFLFSVLFFSVWLL